MLHSSPIPAGTQRWLTHNSGNGAGLIAVSSVDLTRPLAKLQAVVVTGNVANQDFNHRLGRTRSLASCRCLRNIDLGGDALWCPTCDPDLSLHLPRACSLSRPQNLKTMLTPTQYQVVLSNHWHVCWLFRERMALDFQKTTQGESQNYRLTLELLPRIAKLSFMLNYNFSLDHISMGNEDCRLGLWLCTKHKMHNFARVG